MKSESNISKMDAATFKQLFVHRDDIYAMQQPKGSYIPVKDELTDADIEAHLEGRTTLGLYQVMPEVNTVKWGVLDIDLTKDIWSAPDFKLEDWEDRLLAQANRAKDYFSTVGITSYREHSGNKGYHVWIFFKTPVLAANVKTAMEGLFKHMPAEDPGIAWEIFPKQAAVNEGALGNLVKGPAGYHHKSKKFSKFIDVVDPQLITYTTPESLELLTSIYAQPISRCSALNKVVIEGILAGGAKHDERVALGYIYTHMDEGKESEKYITDRFFRQMPNFNEETTLYNLERMQEMYKPITCATLQEQGICPKQCTAIGAAKSPIAFYHWETKKEEAGTAATNKLDFVFKSGNNYYEDLGSDKDGNAKLKQLSSFVVDLDKHVTVSDGLKSQSRFSGLIKKDGFKSEFDISSDDYASNEKLSAYIYSILGPNQLLLDNIVNIRTAIQKYANTEEELILKHFGYMENEDSKYPTKYVTPSTIIDKNGIRENTEVKIDLTSEQNASGLDIKKADLQEVESIKKHMDDHLFKLINYEAGHTGLAYAFLPIIFPFLEGDKTRFTYFIRGLSGSGKSYFLNSLQCFFGNFEGPPTWSSTPNALGRLGYFYNSAMFFVDDWKLRVFKKMGTLDASLTLLQNFADNTARARMTATSEMQKTYVIRGWIAATGEDTPSGEASTLARTVFMDCTNREKNLRDGGIVQKNKHRYSGLTGHYIHHILNLNPAVMNKVMDDHMNYFYPLVAGKPNDVRISRNMSLLATSYKFISKFLWSKKRHEEAYDKYVAMLTTALTAAVTEASEELSGEKFIESLKELLSGGRVRMQADSGIDIEDSNVPIIGYMGRHPDSLDQVPHLVVGLAFSEAQKYLRSAGESFSHTRKAIISEMYEHGMVFDEEPIVRKLNHKSVRVIRLKPEYL